MSTLSPDGDSDYGGGGGEAAGAVMADVLSKGREACYKVSDPPPEKTLPPPPRSFTDDDGGDACLSPSKP